MKIKEIICEKATSKLLDGVGLLTPSGKLISLTHETNTHALLAAKLLKVKVPRTEKQHRSVILHKALIFLLQKGYVRISVTLKGALLQFWSDKIARKKLPEILKRLPLTMEDIDIEWDYPRRSSERFTLEEAEKKYN